MNRHTREHIRHHAERIVRNIRRKLLDRHCISLHSAEYFRSIPDGRLVDGWDCGCRVCRYNNELMKFRTHKRAFYRRLDQAEEAS